MKKVNFNMTIAMEIFKQNDINIAPEALMKNRKIM
jgi:hypothetical protein